MQTQLGFLAMFALLSCGLCSPCTSPEVTSTTFTTQDATIVLNIAYISEFTVKCASGTLSNLYANIDDNIVPVSIIGANKYQVSWTEELKTARSGERIVHVYDEDGYTAFRKAARAGDDTSSIPSFVDVSIVHPGAFNGPWFKSEFLAVVLSVVVAYIAISSKSKLSS